MTLKVQGYYDRSDRSGILVDDLQNIGDLDVTLSAPEGEKHQWSGGLGYRVTQDQVIVDQNDSVFFNRSERTVHLYNAFIQDSIALNPEQWTLTLGSKFEHNDYSGFEVQPGVRLQYEVSKHHNIWGSVTRAVRTPSRGESDMRIDSGTPFFPVSFTGNPDMEAENLLAYELGYKGQLTDSLVLETALFFNDYDDLLSYEILSMGMGIDAGFVNRMQGHVYGLELAPRYEITEWWRLMAAYTLQYNSFELPANALPITPNEAPRHLFYLRSQMDLTKKVQLDVMGRYVGENRFVNFSSRTSVDIPSYVGLDVRVAWRPTRDLELALVGKNLLTPSHPEYRDTNVQLTSMEIQRSVLGTVTWKF